MLMIGWTTVQTREQAENLARDLVSSGLVACVQIDGPVTSCYRWDGSIEQTSEFRLCLKFFHERESDVARHVLSRHPYETPEWITVMAENVSEKYLSWAKATTYN